MGPIVAKRSPVSATAKLLYKGSPKIRLVQYTDAKISAVESVTCFQRSNKMSNDPAFTVH